MSGSPPQAVNVCRHSTGQARKAHVAAASSLAVLTGSLVHDATQREPLRKWSPADSKQARSHCHSSAHPAACSHALTCSEHLCWAQAKQAFISLPASGVPIIPPPPPASAVLPDPASSPLAASSVGPPPSSLSPIPASFSPRPLSSLSPTPASFSPLVGFPASSTEASSTSATAS